MQQCDLTAIVKLDASDSQSDPELKEKESNQ